MDRATSRDALNERHPSFDTQATLVLPSRDSAYETAQTVLETDSGVMLVTSDGGMGKSWLRHLIERELPTGRRSLAVEIGANECIKQIEAKITHRLGLDPADRRAVADFLEDRRRNEERWTLVVEEAQNLTLEMLEEVRILFENSRFSSLLLLGRTSLARRLSLPAYSDFAARISGFEHLPPIDADEAEILLNHYFAADSWSSDDAERLHRDSAGVPALLLSLARREDRRKARGSSSSLSMSSESSRGRTEVKVHQPSGPQPHFSTPLLGPDRPPLRVEDGLIEVGWNSDESDGEEIEGLDDTSPADGRSGPVDASQRPSPLEQHPEVWAERGQDFAPSGPLFARTRSGDDRTT